MLRQIRNRHFFLFDIASLPIAAYASFVLRLERWDLTTFWPGWALFTLLALFIVPLSFRVLGIYSRYWRYASVDEVVLLVGSATISAVLTGAVAFSLLVLLPVDWILPRSIPFLFLLLELGVTAGPRLGIRALVQHWRRRSNGKAARRVLIMGAGDAGSMIARELQQSAYLSMHPVGFIDDDPRKKGVHIYGVPVLGNRDDIPHLVSAHRVTQVIIAMPAAPGKVIREIVDICEQAQVATKTIPGIHELLDGAVSVNQLRDVDIEDLLRRQPVQTDTTAVQALLRGKRVLVTGGGGSIGSELCRQVLQGEPAELILLGHGENSIFAIYHELRRLWPETPVKITPVIADIRLGGRIQSIFARYRPHIVFHAAAHKHVPLMEKNPTEAITNNVGGTQNLLAAAEAVDVQQFVMISTDKAVNPTSIMGASKRAAELLVHQAAMKTGKPYVAVRFGNVLGSRGSVVFTFKRQIAAGGPVTVTHPEMKRFFMTIPEAVQLVLQAATLGSGGEVFVLDMGEPIRIVDLARDLIELSGLEVERDIAIEYIGMRPGEKLFEEMFIQGERYHRTAHEKIFIAANAGSFVSHELDVVIHALFAAAERGDVSAIYRGLQNLIPEFEPVGDGGEGHGERVASRKSWAGNSISSPSYAPS